MDGTKVPPITKGCFFLLSKSAKKTKSKRAYVPPASQKKGNGALIGLTLALIAIAVVVILGINSQSKSQSEPYAFNYSDLPRLGSENAPVKIVEFGDFKCPSCKTFAELYEPKLVKDYIDSGKVALYFVNYTVISADSVTAAAAGEAVFRQKPEAFWPYYDAIYAHQEDEHTDWATPEKMVQIAKDAKLEVDYDKLLTDLQKEVYTKHVNEQYNLAAEHSPHSINADSVHQWQGAGLQKLRRSQGDY